VAQFEMSIRRFTRLTNAFSKKVENLAAAVALWFMYYNFCRVHQTLRVTPAMEAGLSNQVWSLTELVAFIGQETCSWTTTNQKNRCLLNGCGTKTESRSKYEITVE
jgi:hypothetical protein